MPMKTWGVIAFLSVIVLSAWTTPAEAQSNSEYVIVANKEVAGSSIGLATLKGIYLREIKSWGNGGGQIVVVDLASGGNFYQNLFGKSYVQMQAYWLNMRIKYSVELPVSKKDAESVKQFLAENKGSIGFLKSGDVDDRVKILSLNR
jgi:ABC-type phosphate transport system substrate-binding protein